MATRSRGLASFKAESWILLALSASILFLSALLLLPSSGSDRSQLQERQRLAQLLHQCRQRSLATATRDRPSIDLLGTVSRHCYEEVRGEGLLGELIIRRASFVEQAYQGRVILWMVVVITISGVALACLQLVMSFRLAGLRKDTDVGQSEVSLERGKIAVKSSITGLLILVVSFAFFLVYVLWIYTIEEADIISVDREESSEQASEEYGTLENVANSATNAQ